MPSSRAVILDRPGAPPVLRERPDPEPGPGQVRLRVRACAVCRTDLHLLDGELPNPRLPVVPGHQVVGVVDRVGPGVTTPALGDRVGVGWLGWTCGSCEDCRAGRENLCSAGRYTGYTLDGGWADAMVAEATSCFPLPDGVSDLQVAPWLCAGLIGWRAFRMAGEARRVGIYGFGAAAHLLAPVAVGLGREVYAFTRPGDHAAQAFARARGATWAGGSDQPPPVPLDAALIFAADGALVPAALAAVVPGGTVVCGGIHMSDIPAFPYRILWGERTLRSVANLTRVDGVEFLAVASRAGLRSAVHAWPLERFADAVAELRAGRLTGAAVLVMDGDPTPPR